MAVMVFVFPVTISAVGRDGGVEKSGEVGVESKTYGRKTLW